MPAFTPVNPEWRLKTSAARSRCWFFPDKPNDHGKEMPMAWEEVTVFPQVQSNHVNEVSEPATIFQPVTNDFQQSESACLSNDQYLSSAQNHTFPNEIERECRLKELYDKLATIPILNEIETPTRPGSAIGLLDMDCGEVSEKSLNSYAKTIVASDVSLIDYGQRSPQRSLQATNSITSNRPSSNDLKRVACSTPETMDSSTTDCCASNKRYDGAGPLVLIPKPALSKENQQPERWFTTENNTNYIHKYSTRYRSHVPIKERFVRKRLHSKQRRKQLISARAFQTSISSDLDSSPQRTDSSPRQAASSARITEHQDLIRTSPTPCCKSVHVEGRYCEGYPQARDDPITKVGKKPLIASDAIKKNSDETHVHDEVVNRECCTRSFWMSGKPISYTKFCNPEPMCAPATVSNGFLATNTLAQPESELEFISESTFVRAAVLRAASRLVKAKTTFSTRV